MNLTLQTIVSSLDRTVSRATQAAGAVVKPSSTEQDTDGALLDLQADGVTVAALALTLRTTEQQNRTLLDITA